MTPRSMVPGSVLLLVACYLGAASAKDNGADDAPRSQAAIAALKKHERAVAAADAERRRAVVAAERALRDELDAAIKSALKGQNLEEANRINAVLKTRGAASLMADDADALSKLLVRRKFLGYRLANHAVRRIELRPDGSIGDGAAFENRWRAASAHTIVIGGDNFQSECVRCEDGTFRGIFPTGEAMVLYPDAPPAPAAADAQG